MKNVTKIKDFVDSSFDSSTENNFLEAAIPVIMDKNLRDRYAQILHDEHGVDKPTSKKSNNWIKWLIIGILAITIGIVAILYFQTSDNNSVIGQQVATTNAYYEELDLAQRGEINVEITIAEMANAYLKKDSEVVVEKYNSLGNNVQLDNQILYAVAISFAMENNLNKAETVLNKLLETTETPFSFHQEARWKLASILINNNKQTEANTVLSQIKEGHLNYDRAQKMLSK